MLMMIRFAHEAINRYKKETGDVADRSIRCYERCVALFEEVAFG